MTSNPAAVNVIPAQSVGDEEEELSLCSDQKKGLGRRWNGQFVVKEDTTSW